MNEELYRVVASWAIGIITVLGAVIGAWFNHRQNKLDADIQKILADAKHIVTTEHLDRRLTAMDKQREHFYAENLKKLDEIGSTTKAIFAQAIDIGKMDVRIKLLEDRNIVMQHWKHTIVDPYVPRAIMDLERRITNIEKD